MKIKTDFVTNSSSTGFIFMFKGNSKIRFYQKLIERKEKFDLEYCDYRNVVSRCDIWDLLEVIDPSIRKEEGPDRDLWIMKGIDPIEALLEKFENSFEYYKNLYTNSEDDYFEILYKDEKELLEKIKKAISKGFTHYFDIDFGNDGSISGDIGDIMDYEGRNINIDDDELILITEQRR